MTTLELIAYYANLLIFQYLGKPKAYATIQALVTGVVMPQVSTQEITLSGVATSGSFSLSYNSIVTSVSWNASTSTIQTQLQAISGLGSVTVSGSIASQLLTVTFTGVTPPALLLVNTFNSLQAGTSSISVDISETDLTLPLAIQNGFNLIGDDVAQGVQLDTLGKYAGVTRTGAGTQGQPITLSDSDFQILIQMAIVRNNSGSSMSDITNIIYNFFGTSILVFASGKMHLTYMISSVASSNLIQLFIGEQLLPAPMGVGISVIYAPVINEFFAFVTYEAPVQSPVTTPFNDYQNSQPSSLWFSYQYVLTT